MEYRDYTDHINESVGLPQNQDYNFPIKSNTACQFKWTWSTIFLNRGTSSSCHRCNGWDITDDFQNFHNHPGKLHDRSKMLDGKWPGNGCEYCKKIEESDGISERLDYINDGEWIPEELENGNITTSVTPRILEVYFTNLCNQACAYCSPFFSSRIQKEIEKYGPLETEYDLSGFKSTVDYENLKKEFWIWMKKNSQHLYQFQILGGEPLYQPEFDECLSFFENKKHPKLLWKIFSNLKHNPDKFRDKIRRINTLIEENKLKSFQIVCSQDSWGEQGEFARYGMDLKVWEENFNTLLENQNVEISIHSTISPVSLPTMGQFYRKIMEWNKIREVNYGWNTVAHPTFMNPEILGIHAKPYFDDVISALESSGHSVEYFKGFREQVINHPIDGERLTRLYHYLNKLDERRGTNWKSLYPWLDELCVKHNTEIDDINVIDKFIEEELTQKEDTNYRNIEKRV